MSDTQPHDQLDVQAGDQLDQDAGDQLDVQAGDQLDQTTPDQAGQPAGDGETTGDQDTAPAFPDPLLDPTTSDDQDEPDDVAAVTQPNPYSPGYGLVGKFPTEQTPDAGDVLQDEPATSDSQEGQE